MRKSYTDFYFFPWLQTHRKNEIGSAANKRVLHNWRHVFEWETQWKSSNEACVQIQMRYLSAALLGTRSYYSIQFCFHAYDNNFAQGISENTLPFYLARRMEDGICAWKEEVFMRCKKVDNLVRQ